MKRVVITGMGLTSPLGTGVEESFDRLTKFENCVERLAELDNYKGLNTRLGAKVCGFKTPENFNRKVLRTMGPLSVYTVATAIDALTDAGLIDDEVIRNGETGVSYGSCSGSLDALMDFYSMQVLHEVKNLNSGSYIKMMPQTSVVNLSLYFKTTGRLITSSTACTSGSMGIGLAYEAIKYGKQKVMIAGGGEEFAPAQIGIFDTLYATSLQNDNPKISPRPFDKNRDGLVIGEGAGTVILEEYEHAKKRGAKIYAEILGFGTNTDGTHITNPNQETMGKAMELALKDANISADAIEYINAHGTATMNGDIAETNATYNVFKREVPISSLKSYTGHTLGACGAVEAIMSIEMARQNWFAPTLNLEEVDENCGKLDYIKGQGREMKTNIIMSNNFAFGGVNTSLIFNVL